MKKRTATQAYNEHTQRPDHVGQLSRQGEDAWAHGGADADHHRHEQAQVAPECDFLSQT